MVVGSLIRGKRQVAMGDSDSDCGSVETWRGDGVAMESGFDFLVLATASVHVSIGILTNYFVIINFNDN